MTAWRYHRSAMTTSCPRGALENPALPGSQDRSRIGHGAEQQHAVLPILKSRYDVVRRQVGNDEQLDLLPPACERPDALVLGQQQGEVAVHDSRHLMTERDEPAVVTKHGRRV